MFPTPETTFWSRSRGFIWALREPMVRGRYPASNPSSSGSGPNEESRSSSSPASSSRARVKPVSSRRKSLLSPSRCKTSMSALSGSSTGGTSSSWPPILSWKTSESPVPSSMMRCLARRRTPVMLTPSSRLTNSWVEGCSTSDASRTSARSISEPVTSSRRSSFIVSTSGNSGIDVFIPVPHRVISVVSMWFARGEGGVALGERKVAVRSHRLDSKASPFEFCGQPRRVVQPHAMDLFVPPVELSYLPKTHDPALHRTPLDVLLQLGEYCPVLPHAEISRLGVRRHLARAQHVEDEDATGDERVMNTPERATQPPVLVLRVEEVVEDLADRRDRGARRDLDLEERPHPELGLWHPFARELDHGLGDVDPEDAVAHVYELPRPQAATATQVDNKTVANPVSVQDLQYAWRRSQGELSMADVMYVRDVLTVPPRRVRTSRGYLSPP